MTLLERIAARQCSMPDCHEDRIEGMLFGRNCGHANDWITGRIVRREDGTFVYRRALTARDETWRAAA